MALTLTLGYGLLAFGGVVSISSVTFSTVSPALGIAVAVVGVASAIGGLVNVIVGAARAF